MYRREMTRCLVGCDGLVVCCLCCWGLCSGLLVIVCCLLSIVIVFSSSFLSCPYRADTADIADSAQSTQQQYTSSLNSLFCSIKPLLNQFYSVMYTPDAAFTTVILPCSLIIPNKCAAFIKKILYPCANL